MTKCTHCGEDKEEPCITADDLPTPIKGDCVIWPRRASPDGYGRITVNGIQRVAHRVLWEKERGLLPEGMCLDHLCRNHGCVNLDHLEVVTMKENILRGIAPTAINAKKTHCTNGHELTPDNLVPDKDGKRRCRECARIRYAKYTASGNRNAAERRRYHRAKESA